MTLESVARLLPSFAELKTQVILVSGGEPLLNPEWIAIARLLKSCGLQLWLLTSGLSLAKLAATVCELFSSVTVSLDGTNDRTYAAIRGVNAFAKVCDGIRRVARLGAHVGVRVTVQRGNYEELSNFVALAKETGARQISFLAADVSNPHAFGRTLPGGFASDIALRPNDLPKLERLLSEMERERAEDFASGFIAESPKKLRRILDYYQAICGQAEFPPVRCNAPDFSAVIEASGRVRPCFFIPGPAQIAHEALEVSLNDDAMVSLRRDIRDKRRAECATCVCSMWRDLDTLTAPRFV
jgi:MoaA/NifB/PqqE/SkfB family radical SAM enzyme